MYYTSLFCCIKSFFRKQIFKWTLTDDLQKNHKHFNAYIMCLECVLYDRCVFEIEKA